MASDWTDQPSRWSGERQPTLLDVAKMARVSTATVSRSLNTPERVLDGTRKRVMLAIEKLGYSPNFSARALAARRTNTVGAVIPTMENAIFARGLQAFQEELVRNGKTLLVASSSFRSDLEAEQIESLVNRGADALLLIGTERHPAVYEFLRRRGVPTVLAWAFSGDPPAACVGFDNAAAMARLARQVILRGHRRIGVISAPTEANDRARDRIEGVRRAVEDASLDWTKIPVVEAEYDVERGAEAFDRIMATAPETTAVMCGNDVLAAGALRAAKRAGLVVPEDVSITGFDDIELALLVEPTLTTVRVPHREMGFAAARMLVEATYSDGPLTNVELDSEVVHRESLAPPRSNRVGAAAAPDR